MYQHSHSARPRVFAVALAGLLVGGVMPASAQETGTVAGTVVHASTAQPIVGAQVVVTGSGIGTVTNAEGQFLLLNVRPGEREIRVHMLGYSAASRRVDVTAGATTTVEFQLEESAIALDQVVVTGQARETRRREVAASIASVDASELEDAAITSVAEMLQGRNPGVTVLPGGGKVGQGTKIVLRGPSSLSQGVEPLIYVDGVRMDNSTATGVFTGGEGWTGLDDINPNDIERIEVVRGAAAATLYGTEASAGVIQIFTKRGKQGEQRWNYSGEFGVSNSPKDWWGVSVYSDWFYDAYVNNNATQQQHQLSTSGGQEGYSFYASGSYSTQDGLLPGNSTEYKSFRGNLQLFPRSDLVLNIGTGYSDRFVAMPQDANNIYGYGINALTAGPRGLFMPVEEIPLINVGLKSRRFTGNLSAEYKPAEWFSSRATLGVDVAGMDNIELHPYGANDSNPLGRKSNYRRDATTLTADISGVFTFPLSENVRSTSTIGFQGNEIKVGASEASGQEFPVPGLTTVSSAAITSGWEYRGVTRTAGVVFQQDVGLFDRLFLNAGFRLDGHSAFGDDAGYAFYPKGGVSYVVSDHEFFPDLFDSFRVRGAYGTAGRQPGAFDAVRTWSAISAVDGVPAVTPSNIGNSELGPEISHELELGFDASAWNGRVGMQLTWYRQRTEDALLPVSYPPSDGFVGSQLENVGEIQNTGLELAVNGTVLALDDFVWSAHAQFATFDNEVTDLGDLPELYQHWTQITREGYPVASYFGDRFVMEDGEVVVAADDYIGPPFPTKTFQLGMDFTLWDRVNVRGLMDHAGGHFIESSTVRWLTRTNVPNGDEIVDESLWGTSVASWCHDSGADELTQAICESPWPESGRGNVVRPADYWKLREVTVSYNLPQSMFAGLGLESARVFLSGRNIWRHVKDHMLMEPEANYSTGSDLSQQDYFNTPIPRTLIFGINVGF
ncbi:MAG TPA: TonB-dependent receptor [Longimicrobiales bacterium]|nr:TonB-dependent receptor [Longimicrobiales bacterium]